MKREGASLFCIATLIFIVVPYLTFALQAGQQEQAWRKTLDSMLHATTTAQHDTNLVRLYMDIGTRYSGNSFEKAKEFYLKADDLSEKLNWNRGRYLSSAGFANILYYEGLLDSGIVVTRRAHELAKRAQDEYWIAGTMMNVGNGYYYKGWYEMALTCFQEALHTLEKLNANTGWRIILYNNIGTLYKLLDLPEKAIDYQKKTLALFDAQGDLLQKGAVLYNLATACQIIHDNEAEYYFKEALHIAQQINNQVLITRCYLALGEIALYRDRKEAEYYFREALQIATTINTPQLVGFANHYLGFTELCKGNLKQAENYSTASLNIAVQIGFTEYQAAAYRQLAVIHAMRHDFNSYRIHAQKADSVDRSLAKTSTLRSAEEMQAKYETEKKELQITALKEEKRLILWLGFAGGTVLLLALAASFFRWRWLLQKRQLAETRIKQLEQEKQLVATQSLLDGETRERARLARDLHDSLGSMLTGAQLNLQEFKKGALLEYADVTSFDHALGLLNRSIHEMRRVAHHLMPDSLSRFGLKSAIRDYCTNLPTVQFAHYGDESRLDPKVEVMIYRSIHELVNNALKHAGANKIMVQLMQEPGRIAFTVQDNGCGFDPQTATQGMGLQNIRNRVASYNGILEIDSRLGEGTEINVELETDNEHHEKNSRSHC